MSIPHSERGVVTVGEMMNEYGLVIVSRPEFTDSKREIDGWIMREFRYSMTVGRHVQVDVKNLMYAHPHSEQETYVKNELKRSLGIELIKSLGVE